MLSRFRHTILILLRSPGFTITIVLILGLGIGANTAIFSLVNGVMLRPHPYPRADRLVLFVQTFQHFDTVALGYADYLDFSGAQHSFENLTACNNNDFTLSGQSDPERISGLYVTGTFFKVLGRPFLTRRREINIRAAVGAGRLRLVLQLLAENSLTGKFYDLDHNKHQPHCNLQPLDMYLLREVTANC
jgi:putative ABC transport system permease protein